ncbi:MAG: hypothetical protein AAF449_02955 [Myxococcota bacterium]
MADSTLDVSERDIRRLIQGELNSFEAERVRAVLRQSEAARRRYDRWVRAERALEGTHRPALGDAANARVKARLFGEPTVPAAPRGLWLAWPFAMSVAAATAAVFMVSPAPVENSSSAFQARGEPAVSVSPRRMLQVLQVSAAADGQFDVRPAEMLRPGDELRFAVFVDDAPARVSVVAVDEDGHRQVLMMRAALNPKPVAQRLDVALSVPDDWLGPTRFVGVFEFSDDEVDLSTVDLSAKDKGTLSVRVVRAVVVAADAERRP